MQHNTSKKANVRKDVYDGARAIIMYQGFVSYPGPIDACAENFPSITKHILDREASMWVSLGPKEVGRLLESK
jgi:hypothetical protein